MISYYGVDSSFNRDSLLINKFDMSNTMLALIFSAASLFNGLKGFALD